MTPVRRDTQHALLLLLGGALLRISLDDTFLRYVRPSHRWWLIGAGAVMVVLAATVLLRDLRATPPETDGHEHGADRSSWLLLLPVLVIALVAPPALGSDAVNRSAPDEVRTVANDLPPGPLELGVAEVVGRSTGIGSLDGREVTVTGFVAHREGEILLARLTINCCAADARPYTVALVGAGLAPVADVPVDTWLRVSGTVTPGSATRANRYTPELTVLGAEQISAPDDPYEY